MSRKTPFMWIFREFKPEGALGEVCEKLFVTDIQGDRASRDMTVTYLQRRKEGFLTLEGLALGQIRELTEDEIQALEQIC